MSADWRVLRPDETAHSLDGTCLVCPDRWRPDGHGYLVDVTRDDVWAHLGCVARRRGALSSTEYLNRLLDRREEAVSAERLDSHRWDSATREWWCAVCDWRDKIRCQCPCCLRLVREKTDG